MCCKKSRKDEIRENSGLIESKWKPLIIKKCQLDRCATGSGQMLGEKGDLVKIWKDGLFRLVLCGL